jgi:hypothetical protein
MVKPLSIISDRTAKNKRWMQESYLYGEVQGPEKVNDTCVKTVHAETMDRRCIRCCISCTLWFLELIRIYPVTSNFTITAVLLLIYHVFLGEFLLDLFSTQNQLDDKPDYVNYRLLLWKAMTEFPEVCETKNRDIAPLFLTFLE